MTHRPPSLQGQFLAATLRNLAGSTRWHIVLLATLVLVLFSWFTDHLWDVIEKRLWPEPIQWMALLSFPLMLVWMVYRARSIEKTIIPEVQCEVVDQNSIQKVECLIVFLSPPNKDSDIIDSLLADTANNGSLAEVQLKMQGPWRMPLEAIHMHLGRLKQVAVICSADAMDKADGTWREFDRFKELVLHLTNQSHIEVFDAAAEIWQQDKQSPQNKGVDFEDVTRLVDLVNSVYQRFYEQGIEDRDIMVDITGGQKVATIAGAAIALAEGRRFQYVSPRGGYKVHHYNVTYHGL